MFLQQVESLRPPSATRTFPRHSRGPSAGEYIWGWGLKDSFKIHLSVMQTPLVDTRARHQHCLYLVEIEMKAMPRKATLPCWLCVLHIGHGAWCFQNTANTSTRVGGTGHNRNYLPQSRLGRMFPILLNLEFNSLHDLILHHLFRFIYH